MKKNAEYNIGFFQVREKMKKVIGDKSVVSGEMVFDINPKFSNYISQIILSPLQWRIISLVDGKKNLRYVSRFLDAGEDEVKSSLSDLLSKGLIEIVDEKVHSYEVKPAEAVVTVGEDKGSEEEEIVTGQNVKHNTNFSRRLILRIIDNITDL